MQTPSIRPNITYSYLKHIPVYRSWCFIKGIYLRNKTQRLLLCVALVKEEYVWLSNVTFLLLQQNVKKQEFCGTSFARMIHLQLHPQLNMRRVKSTGFFCPRNIKEKRPHKHLSTLGKWDMGWGGLSGSLTGAPLAGTKGEPVAPACLVWSVSLLTSSLELY